MEGKLIRGVAGFFYVRTETGTVWQCKAKGTFRREGIRPLAGDNVSFEVTHEADKEGNIESIHPRKNELLRPPVVNIDQALLVFACAAPAVNHHLLGRFLVMMRQKELPLLLCFNKRDLDEAQAASLLQDYAGSGCSLHAISVAEDRGIRELAAELKGKTSVVAGPSGVGKSSLINALCAEAGMETGDVSRKTGHGRNTTRHSELFALSEAYACGVPSYLCDTPGFMSLKTENTDARDLHLWIPEFEPYADKCRYDNCTHLTEPDCAVKEALSEGKIARLRYEDYRLLYEELRGERPVYVKKAKKG
ncbi:MAG: ribosome small subunit-dependent GTPase A [Lachnospiraceae bacterium]|nr:ribosome small subunit-dependent GTPase A [Lachnospiraceae bacterium]